MCIKVRDTTFTYPKCPFLLVHANDQKIGLWEYKESMYKKRTFGTSGPAGCVND